MKTKITLLIAILTLQINFLIAGSDGLSSNSTHALHSGTTISLAPSTPPEATFEDVATPADFASLAPKTPGIASFEDETNNTDNTALAPVAPAVADFEELN